MTNRSRYLDILKLIACVGVVLIHSSSYRLELFELGSFDYVCALAWDSVSRFAVPVFFMCTGALMLPPERELTAKRIYKDYFLRVLIILLVWSFLYGMAVELGSWVLYRRHSVNPVLYELKETLRFSHFFHLYYLQILLLLYAALPVLRVFVRAAGEKELHYALGLWLVLGIALPLLRQLPPLNKLGGLWNQAEINMTWSSLGYALLGYYLSTHDAWSKKRSVLLIAIGLAVTFGGTLGVSLYRNETFTAFMEGMSPGPLLMAAGIFSFVKAADEGKNSSPKLARAVRASFCVYLVHYFFIMAARTLLPQLSSLAAVSIPLEAAAVIVCSVAVWFVLSKIPFVNKRLI